MLVSATPTTTINALRPGRRVANADASVWIRCRQFSTRTATAMGRSWSPSVLVGVGAGAGALFLSGSILLSIAATTTTVTTTTMEPNRRLADKQLKRLKTHIQSTALQNFDHHASIWTRQNRMIVLVGALNSAPSTNTFLSTIIPLINPQCIFLDINNDVFHNFGIRHRVEEAILHAQRQQTEQDEQEEVAASMKNRTEQRKNGTQRYIQPKPKTHDVLLNVYKSIIPEKLLPPSEELKKIWKHLIVMGGDAKNSSTAQDTLTIQDENDGVLASFLHQPVESSLRGVFQQLKYAGIPRSESRIPPWTHYVTALLQGLLLSSSALLSSSSSPTRQSECDIILGGKASNDEERLRAMELCSVTKASELVTMILPTWTNNSNHGDNSPKEKYRAIRQLLNRQVHPFYQIMIVNLDAHLADQLTAVQVEKYKSIVAVVMMIHMTGVEEELQKRGWEQVKNW